jgi:pyruvate kinase
MVQCQNSAKLGEKKNMNLPGAIVNLPTLTENDEVDLVEFGLKQNVDFVAASFVRKGSDVEYIREVLGEKGAHIKIISKIEN